MKNDYHHLRPGLVAKIDYSIALLRKAESLALKYDHDDGFYLAFSGGKDSQCLYHVAQLAGVRFKAHFSPTSVDPPQLIRFIKRNYPDVEFRHIEQSIYDVAVKQGILPTMTVRWCCSIFKETSGAGKVTLIGIRHAESVKRSKRNEVEITGHKFSGDLDGFNNWSKEQIEKKFKGVNHDQFSIDKETEVKCISGKDTIAISPIINWDDRDVWDFLNGMDIEHCELYDAGYKRIGCILCPMSSRKGKVRDIHDFPHVKEKWIKAIMAIRNRGGMQPQTALHHHYEESRWIASNQPARQRHVVGGKKPRNLGSTFPESPADNAAAEQGEGKERQIAEAIFDWWISGKSYSEWYAEKFQQLKIDFDNGKQSKADSGQSKP